MTDTPTIGHAVQVADTAGMSRDDWLAHRRAGIGGSDVAAILGMSQWATPLSVWLDKTGTYTPEDRPSEAMEWGNILEPVVADEFSKRSGIPTVEHKALLAHPEYPWMLANVDRIILPDVNGTRQFLLDEGLGVYEGKTTNAFARKDWGTEDDPKVPDYALLQTHHYLAVCGLSYAYIAALIGGQKLLWRRVDRDEEMIDRLIALESDFWQLVTSGEPPQPMAADSELLGQVWTPDPEETVELSDDLLQAIVMRQRAKDREKVAKDEAAELEAEIKLAMTDREYGVDADGNVRVSWREVPASKVEAYERAAYRRFTVTKMKETK